MSVPGLIYKLSQTGFSQAALQWFSSFLTTRRQCVPVNGSCSSWETATSRIPQGTVLGSTFFLLFINDLPECLVNECALFADDAPAYGVGKDSSQMCSTLSLDMKAASNWAKTWGMLFNAQKSEHLSITGNAQNSNSCRIDMKTTKIPKVTTHKHLGITVNSMLSWSDHIKSVYTNCTRKIGMLKRLKRKLRPSAFKRIYTGAIALMQNKLCDVTKCLTTVAAGVLSGRDRKKKLETGLLFQVLLRDWQISFGVRLFFVTRCPHVPLVACQKAQTRKNCANWATFRVKISS